MPFASYRSASSFDFGHECDLVLFHRDLVRVDLLLALGGQVAARPHRQRVRDEAGDARHYDGLERVRGGCTDHACDQAEIGGEAVVEAVHDVPDELARIFSVPGLVASTAYVGERSGVICRLTSQEERRVVGFALLRGRAVKRQVPLYLARLLPK